MLGIAKDFYADTDQGRQRRGNEDSHFARRPLFAVADGMGGAQAGEIASGIAVSVFEHGVPDGEGSVEERLASLVQDANARIHELSRSDEERAGMGTTLTSAYLDEDELSIAHVGDSRLYRLRDGVIERLTRDHSLVEELVQEGRLTPEEAEEHPQRSIITRALGPEQHVLVDHFTHRVRAGDVYLICSDGLTSMVRDEHRLAELIEGSATLREAGRTLIDAANAAGGRDNITVILFRIEEIGAAGGAGGPGSATTAAAGGPGTAPATDDDRTMVGATAPRSEEVRAALAASGARTSEGPAATGGRRTGGAVAEAPARRIPRTPTGPPPKRRRRGRKALRVLVVLLAIGVPIVGGAWVASQSVYFVGTDDDGFVTLYRGMPYDLPAGVSLYSVNYTSGVPASALTAKVQDTVTAHKLRSRDDAADLVKQIEQGKLVGQQGGQ
ncbi:Stp1/IreP family PP2C-type Ser/Thr phosphatase [Paraconexibacter antarcticus]|uniref:Stp1/IreP family PP2C-type Ser/Thr phosphatase n=1 Tax=Paraconexibacter antarcticus TaxID=2949664 RepID=A0ABY5DUV7_9ACTN|nr:Stp1/IreP family PP2C-type Ser/Thr phosphatase [Paraconexibacter antarcticus]UTI64622.1 Stp1/IreP family PP2C-type Ser/Thr phosphatase [Paraconexibacter antarcticus]